MQTLHQMYPSIKSGAVISAVDLIRGIGHYAGLRTIVIPGMTGLADTNYEGKAKAAVDALRTDDFVFLHVEATDEAGHDGNIDLKIRAIEYLDNRIVGPVMDELADWDEPVRIALLPDHATPVERRIHIGEPVPFTIYTPGGIPDDVTVYDEKAAHKGLRDSPSPRVHGGIHETLTFDTHFKHQPKMLLLQHQPLIPGDNARRSCGQRSRYRQGAIHA